MKKMAVTLAALSMTGCGAGSEMGGGAVPPSDVMASCLRILVPGGEIRDAERGLIRFDDFVRTVAAKPDSLLTWERYGERSYILHDVVLDRVTGNERRLDLRVYTVPEPGPSGPDCGPGQVVIDRVVLNGVEAQGYEVPQSVNAMMAKVPKSPD